jgi:hypothetical protein
MCNCLGKAIRRHIDFSKSIYWFLDELNEVKKEKRALKNELMKMKGEKIEESGNSI